MKQIEIDIDVHKCIENAREDFDETPNQILRRLLMIDMDEPDFIRNSSGLGLKKEVPPVFSYKELSSPDEDVSAYQSSLLRSRIQSIRIESQKNWVYGGASLPEGTKLRKWLGKQKIEAVILNGSIYVNGEYHQSPSSAAMAVNGGTNVNGWLFWEYFDESSKCWNKISMLRKGGAKK